MATRPASGVLLKKKTTTMNITPPHMPPRRSDRRHDGTGASRTGRRLPPEEVVFAFGLSGLPFFARSSDADVSISLPSSS